MYYYITSTFRVRDGTSFKRGNYWPGELCTKYPRTAHLIISYVHATSDGDVDHRLSRRMARHFDRQYLYAVSAPLEGNKLKIYICILMYTTYYLHKHNCVGRQVDYLATLFSAVGLFRVRWNCDGDFKNHM